MGIFSKDKEKETTTDVKDEKPKKTKAEKSVEVELLIESYDYKGCHYTRGDVFKLSSKKVDGLVNIGRVQIINTTKK